MFQSHVSLLSSLFLWYFINLSSHIAISFKTSSYRMECYSVPLWSALQSKSPSYTRSPELQAQSTLGHMLSMEQKWCACECTLWEVCVWVVNLFLGPFRGPNPRCAVLTPKEVYRMPPPRPGLDIGIRLEVEDYACISRQTWIRHTRGPIFLDIASLHRHVST